MNGVAGRGYIGVAEWLRRTELALAVLSQPLRMSDLVERLDLSSRAIYRCVRAARAAQWSVVVSGGHYPTYKIERWNKAEQARTVITVDGRPVGADTGVAYYLDTGEELDAAALRSLMVSCCDIALEVSRGE